MERNTEGGRQPYGQDEVPDLSWLDTPRASHNAVEVFCGEREGIFQALVNKVFCNCRDCQRLPDAERFFSLSAFEIHGGRQAAKQPKRSIKVKEDGNTLLRWLEQQHPQKKKRRSPPVKPDSTTAAPSPQPSPEPDISVGPLHGELDLLAAAAADNSLLPAGSLAGSLPAGSLPGSGAQHAQRAEELLPHSRPLTELHAEVPSTAPPPSKRPRSGGQLQTPGKRPRRRQRRRRRRPAADDFLVTSEEEEEEMVVDEEEEEESLMLSESDGESSGEGKRREEQSGLEEGEEWEGRFMSWRDKKAMLAREEGSGGGAEGARSSSLELLHALKHEQRLHDQQWCQELSEERLQDQQQDHEQRQHQREAQQEATRELLRRLMQVAPLPPQQRRGVPQGTSRAGSALGGGSEQRAPLSPHAAFGEWAGGQAYESLAEAAGGDWEGGQGAGQLSLPIAPEAATGAVGEGPFQQVPPSLGPAGGVSKGGRMLGHFTVGIPAGPARDQRATRAPYDNGAMRPAVAAHGPVAGRLSPALAAGEIPGIPPVPSRSPPAAELLLRAIATGGGGGDSAASNAQRQQVVGKLLQLLFKQQHQQQQMKQQRPALMLVRSKEVHHEQGLPAAVEQESLEAEMPMLLPLQPVPASQHQILLQEQGHWQELLRGEGLAAAAGEAGRECCLQSLAMVQDLEGRATGADLKMIIRGMRGTTAELVQLVRDVRDMAAAYALSVQSMQSPHLPGLPTEIGVPVILRVVHTGENPPHDLQDKVLSFVENL